MRLVGALKEADTKPDTIVSRTFYRLAYRDHPYALRSTGEVKSVENITREDLLGFLPAPLRRRATRWWR